MLGKGVVEDLYARYSRSVFRRSRALLGDDAVARDTTDRVFRRIIHLRGPLPSEPAPAMAWFYRVTTDLCLHWIRHDKHAENEGAQPDRDDTQVEGPRPAAHASAAASSPLRQLVEAFPRDLQEVAVYFFLDQMTFDEIANVVGVSNRTVAHRLSEFRALVQHPDPQHPRMAS